MALQLASEEPEGGPWRAAPLTIAVECLLRLGGGRGAGGQGVVLAIDGRSSSGKATLAARLRDAITGSAVVHTDDIAWWHSRFGWADLLIEGVLVPFHSGELVSFRPPGWAGQAARDPIQVPAGCPVLIIEGVGAGRSEVSELIGALVWVRAGRQEAERRSLARLGQPGGAQRADLMTVPGQCLMSLDIVVEQEAHWSDAGAGAELGRALVASQFVIREGAVAYYQRHETLSAALAKAGLTERDAVTGAR